MGAEFAALSDRLPITDPHKAVGHAEDAALRLAAGAVVASAMMLDACRAFRAHRRGRQPARLATARARHRQPSGRPAGTCDRLLGARTTLPGGAVGPVTGVLLGLALSLP